MYKNILDTKINNPKYNLIIGSVPILREKKTAIKVNNFFVNKYVTVVFSNFTI